jgi:hypothetical protein
MVARLADGGSPVRVVGGVEAEVCVDAEVLRAGVMLAEAETRPDSAGGGPSA